MSYFEIIKRYMQFQKKTSVGKTGLLVKLTIKIKEQIVSDGLLSNEYDVTNVGKHLSAKEWNESMENGAIIGAP